MTGIELYSTTAASNNSATPNGWPEGQSPSSVNDCARQMMASIRTWYETAEWINFGHTPTYIGATQFSVPTNLTTTYQVGRRIKAVGSTPFTIYGTITVSAYASVTTVTVSWDSGSLNGTLTAVSVGSASVTNPSIYTSAVSGLTAAIAAAGAPFIDSTAIMKGSADATKLLKIEVDGITTGTTRTLTAPDFDGTITTLAGTETLTNKTISTSTITDSSVTFVDDGDTTKKLAFQCSEITTGTTRTVTIPDKSGTMAMTSDIAGPAFSAYGSAVQSLANATITKINFNTEEWDTANCYDSATNYRFTPNVAGYYLIEGAIGLAVPSANGPFYAAIFKNGSVYRQGVYSTAFQSPANGGATNVSSIVYLNGSTDYVELWGYQNTGGAVNGGSSAASLSFQGTLIRIP